MEKIIRLKTRDLSEVLGIFQRVVHGLNEQGIDQWDYIYPDEATIKEDLDQRCLFALIKANQKTRQILGLITLNHYQDKEYQEIQWALNDPCPLVIHRLCVDPPHQGKGYSKKMIDFAIHFAKKKGFSSVRLDAFEKNPVSMKLYPSFGFIPRGQVRFRKGLFQVFELIL